MSHLAVRDQAVIALFFGVVLGVDTLGRPELDCSESLSASALASLRAGPVGDDHWSILRFSSRSAAIHVTTWALVLSSPPVGDVVDLPALPGRWWVDEMVAHPRNSGHLSVNAGVFAPLVVSDVALAAREGLAAGFDACVQDRMLGGVGWNVLALVNFKHG